MSPYKHTCLLAIQFDLHVSTDSNVLPSNLIKQSSSFLFQESMSCQHLILVTKPQRTRKVWDFTLLERQQLILPQFHGNKIVLGQKQRTVPYSQQWQELEYKHLCQFPETQFPWGDGRRVGWHTHGMQRGLLGGRNPELKEPESYIMKWWDICPGGKHCLYCTGQ